jgi:hypothetical protein
MLVLLLCACGSNGFYKELNGRLDAGQADKISLEDLQKLGKGNTAYSNFVLSKWKILYTKKIFGNNVDPTELYQQTLLIENAAKDGNKEAEAFLVTAQTYGKSVNGFLAQKASAPSGPAVYSDAGPLEVLKIRVLPATDMINTLYVYRKVEWTTHNRGNQMVTNATISLNCYDSDGKLLGPSDVQVHNIDAGEKSNDSEDVRDGTCSVKVVSVRY